ncbi:hypothetical protein [Flavobacterium filum]|uniref:hypothetical protein n=1 Tax=Flavobacterium filum TaxID=370974 RepID=UPI000551831E|nr:hypothetical protein [Flavobacterium filum]
MKTIQFSILVVVFSITTSFSQSLPQMVKYDFKFDWLAAHTINQNINVGTESVHGIGWCRLFVKNKITGNEDQIQPTGFRYIGNYGRVFEVPRNGGMRVSNGDVKSLMNTKVRFQFEPAKYGYKTMKELEDNAYFKVVYEIKVYKPINDEIVGKQDVIIFLKDAKINPVSLAQAKNSANSSTRPGYIRFNKAKYNLGILYSIVPVN